MEQELLNTIRKKEIYSLENNVLKSIELLSRQTGQNGDNLHSLLVRLISRLLDNPPANVVDHFEEYCRLAKIEFLSPVRHYFRMTNTPMQPGVSTQKQFTHAEQILNALTQIETESLRLRPELNMLINCGLNIMGWDLPPGYDYFISAQIDRTLHNNFELKSCQFWGVIRSLGCDYYILELEHREKSVDYCDLRGVIGRHPEIVTNILDALVEDTNKTIDAVNVESVETIKELSQSMLMEIIGNVEFYDGEKEQEQCQQDIDVLLTELIDHLSCTSLEKMGSSSVSFSNSSDPCASERLPAQSAASLLRSQLERMQTEVRLNRRSYLVTENPCTKPWHTLPQVTVEQIQEMEGVRLFLVGNLQAKVRGVGKRFHGLEKNILRAMVAKISAHRDCHIDGSETNITLEKCLSGIYGSVPGYNQELLHERVERWFERKEHGMQYWASETWPGLCSFNDGDQFRCCYFGWGLEKQTRWYSPIVRIPTMREEYVTKLDQGDNEHESELPVE